MAELMSNIELIMWNLGSGDPPLISRVRDRLDDAGLSRSHAEDMPLSTAFRRACDSLRNDKMEVKIFKQSNDLHCQVDSVSLENGRVVRDFRGVYRCHDTNQIRGIDFYCDSSICVTLQQDLDENLRRYQWGDVSKVVQSVIAKCGLGAYSPRRGGGIYFAPSNPDRPALLDQIERFTSYVGIRFLRYTIPDTDAQREEIMDAVAAGIEQEVIDHEDSVNGYTDPTQAILDRRVQALDATASLLMRLRPFLQGKYDSLADRITAMKQRISTFTPAATRPLMGGRRFNFVSQ